MLKIFLITTKKKPPKIRQGHPSCYRLLSRFGWKLEENIPVPAYGIIAIVPKAFLELVACGCNSGVTCSSNACSYRSAGHFPLLQGVKAKYCIEMHRSRNTENTGDSDDDKMGDLWMMD
jgi:hypothetical protein